MYSLVLMMAMTTGNDVPQGLFFNRGGCSGVHAPQVVQAATVRVRSVVQATVVRPVATALANRPRLFGHLRSGVGCSGTAVAATGCSGMSRTAPIVASVGCSGSRAIGVAYAPMPTAPVVQPAEFGKIGGRIERAAIHRQLRVALRHDSLTPDQRAIAQKALDNPDVYEDVVSEIHKSLANAKPPVGGESVGKIGDGTLLKLLLANLPQIIAAIEQILKLFAMGAITDTQMYAMINALMAPYEQVWEQLPPLWKLAA